MKVYKVKSVLENVAAVCNSLQAGVKLKVIK